MQSPDRYIRQINLPGFGLAAQQKLQQAKVLVVGAGGLGVPVLQYLAAMGVGLLGIVDGDTVSISNLNRQVIYTPADEGQPKVAIARARLQQQNDQVAIETYNTHLTVYNAVNLITPYDLVVDATDNFAARYLINDACVILGKPFVYGAIHRFEGQVSVFNHLDGPTYRCLYPVPPAAAEIPDCNTAGVLGVVPAIIGCCQALEAVKVLTGKGKPLSGIVQIYDLLNNEAYQLRLRLKPENKSITTLAADYTNDCGSDDLLQPNQLLEWYHSGRHFLLIDVRELKEHQRAHLENDTLIPLIELAESAPQLAADVPVVVYCQKGGRSLKAAQLLKDKYADVRIFSLAGGIDLWLQQVGNKYIIE